MLRRLMVGSLLVSFAAGCASPATTLPLVPAMPAATATNNIVPAAFGETLLTTPGKALVTTPEKALATSVTLKADMSILADLDDELRTAELSVIRTTGFATKGWFSDLKHKFNNWNTARKLKSEAKKQLKKSQEEDLTKYQDKILAMKKKNTDVRVTVNNLTAGGREVTSTWDTTHEKTSHVTVVQILDAENIEQSKTLTETGTMSGNRAFETIRSRKLVDDDGTIEVYSKRTVTNKDGKTETQEWTNVVKADGSETIIGTVTNKAGDVTKITGTRSADGRLTLNPAVETPARVAATAAASTW
ncbi:MAG: hypothetical protein H7338_17975 [Candidatus Sericytochromatia bacterium]|nr:hypothetical protein [Candidatus Sericytochromatia bacterium]